MLHAVAALHISLSARSLSSRAPGTGWRPGYSGRPAAAPTAAASVSPSASMPTTARGSSRGSCCPRSHAGGSGLCRRYPTGRCLAAPRPQARASYVRSPHAPSTNQPAASCTPHAPSCVLCLSSTHMLTLPQREQEGRVRRGAGAAAGGGPCAVHGGDRPPAHQGPLGLLADQARCGLRLTGLRRSRSYCDDTGCSGGLAGNARVAAAVATTDAGCPAEAVHPNPCNPLHPAGFRHAQKLELAINSSIMVVAAFTNVDLYPRAGLPSETGGNQTSTCPHATCRGVLRAWLTHGVALRPSWGTLAVVGRLVLLWAPAPTNLPSQ